MNASVVNRLFGAGAVLVLAVPAALVITHPGPGAAPGGNVSVRLVASAPPVADLVLNPPTGTAPVSLTADGSGSTDDIGVMSYAFDWGDGSTSSAEIEPTRRHTYATPGSYVVTLTVADSDGGRASTSKTLTVTSDPTPAPDAPPVARVSVTPSSGTAPLNVDVDGGTSSDDRGIAGYLFDFGDGSSTVAQPSSTVQHSYTDAGTFTIRLTVTDGGGQTSAATTTVTVAGAPPPPPPPTARPVTVSFTFDDTFADQVPAAAALAQAGMRGTFYVNSPRLGTTSTYMSRAEADALQSAGHEIGGHTLTHPDLDTVTAAEARHQICDDRTALLGMGYRVSSFAYPFGSTNATVKQVVSDCGYNSARSVGDLRSPGYGCLLCSTAETLPPGDLREMRTNTSVQSDTTLDMLEQYVTQAENDQGGWVPLVFHHVCSGCATNAIDLATFRSFVDWLSRRPSTTQVKTVQQVIGRPVLPAPTDPPPSTATPTPTPTASPTAATVTAGTRTHVLTGTNVARTAGALVRYQAPRTATGTNEFGTEVSVVNGVVTALQTSVGNMTVPAGGYVLSGHGESGTWLRANATVGARISLS